MTREEIILALLILTGIAISSIAGILLENLRLKNKYLKKMIDIEDLITIDGVLTTTLQAQETFDYEKAVNDFVNCIGVKGMKTLKRNYDDYALYIANRTSQILKIK